MGTAPMSCPSFDLYHQIVFYLYQRGIHLSSGFSLFHIINNKRIGK